MIQSSEPLQFLKTQCCKNCSNDIKFIDNKIFAKAIPEKLHNDQMYAPEAIKKKAVTAKFF